MSPPQRSNLAIGGGGSSLTVQEEGSNLTQRTKLNFIGTAVTATDNAGTGATDVTVSAQSQATADSRYQTQFQNIVGPAGYGGQAILMADASSAAIGLNTLRASRVIIPHAGTIADLMVLINTSSGNVKGLIYDTGDATANSRTAVWTGASVASAAGWLSLGNPALVVAQGQHLDFAIIADNGTVQCGRNTTNTTGVFTLPTGYLTGASAALPKLGWTNSAGTFAAPPTPVTEGNAAGGLAPALFCRVT